MDLSRDTIEKIKITLIKWTPYVEYLKTLEELSPQQIAVVDLYDTLYIHTESIGGFYQHFNKEDGAIIFKPNGKMEIALPDIDVMMHGETLPDHLLLCAALGTSLTSQQWAPTIKNIKNWFIGNSGKRTGELIN